VRGDRPNRETRVAHPRAVRGGLLLRPRLVAEGGDRAWLPPLFLVHRNLGHLIPQLVVGATARPRPRSCRAEKQMKLNIAFWVLVALFALMFVSRLGGGAFKPKLYSC